MTADMESEPTFDIGIQVESSYEGLVSIADLERTARAVLTAEGQPAGVGLSVVIVGDEQIRALNRDYRDLDEPTDVLAFSALEGEPLAVPEGETVYLGDVVIS